MSKKLSTEQFIEKARSIHGNNYDYSRVEYVTAHTKIEIICPEHGSFGQKPNSHLTGHGCKQCGLISNGQSRRKNITNFLDKARASHGNKYDYSKSKYSTADEKIEIICPDHGSFFQRTIDHINGRGCALCGGTKKLSNEEFIHKAKEIHGDEYDYSKVEYGNSTTKVEIICREHGSFLQSPRAHSFGQGCPNCFSTKKLTTTQFKEKAINIHGNKYDYSKIQYITKNYKVEIICPEHGSFFQIAGDHIYNSAGCRKCANANNKGCFTFESLHSDKDLSNSPAIIYVCRLFSETEEFYKIGITTKTVEERFKQIPYEYEILFSVETILLQAFETEQFILNLLPRYIPQKEFGGMYECRSSLYGLQSKDIRELI